MGGMTSAVNVMGLPTPRDQSCFSSLADLFFLSFSVFLGVESDADVEKSAQMINLGGKRWENGSGCDVDIANYNPASKVSPCTRSR